MRSSKMPGADSTPKRGSTPDRNAGGVMVISMVPSCTPWTMAGIAPSWLSG